MTLLRANTGEDADSRRTANRALAVTPLEEQRLLREHASVCGECTYGLPYAPKRAPRSSAVKYSTFGRSDCPLYFERALFVDVHPVSARATHAARTGDERPTRKATRHLVGSSSRDEALGPQRDDRHAFNLPLCLRATMSESPSGHASCPPFRHIANTDSVVRCITMAVSLSAGSTTKRLQMLRTHLHSDPLRIIGVPVSADVEAMVTDLALVYEASKIGSADAAHLPLGARKIPPDQAICRACGDLVSRCRTSRAGKSTYAKTLATERRALLLSPDSWMLPLFGQPEAGGNDLSRATHLARSRFAAPQYECRTRFRLLESRRVICAPVPGGISGGVRRRRLFAG